jgi:hypothetical protein
MLTAVICAGKIRSRKRVCGPFRTGKSDTTIGNSRTPLRPTAIATSISGEPAPSAEIRITCAGPAQIRMVDSATHQTLNPKSWASAPMPIYVPNKT